MVRVFWAQCPECDEEFHAHHGELRHSGVKLHCPICEHRFLDSEAANIKE